MTKAELPEIATLAGGATGAEWSCSTRMRSWLARLLRI
jgi:hypothetical protein